MSAPTKDSISELNYSWLGQPFVAISPSEPPTPIQEQENVFSIYTDSKNILIFQIF